MIRRRRASMIVLALVGGVIGALLVTVATQTDVRAAMSRGLEVFREAGPVPFFAAMAVLPALGAPLSAFTFAAGPVFGPTMGVPTVVACAVLAVTINVAISYWVAARALRPVVQKIVRRLGYQLPEIRPHAAWGVILVLRIVPGPPFLLQSSLLGLARVPFAAYMIVSTLVPSAYIAATILFGDALMRGDRDAMAGAGALFLVAAVIIHVLRKRMKAIGENRESGKSEKRKTSGAHA